MFEISRLTRLALGYVGETESRVISIDVREWLQMWPKAIITIWVMRPDKNGYYAATETKDGILTWTVTAGDVAFAGDGLAQVKALDPHGSGAVYKSRTVGTKIYASLEEMTSDPDAPDPMEAWANQAASYKADAEKARDEAVRARDDTVEAAIISAPPIIGEAKGKVVTISKAAERLAQSVVSTISVQQTGTGTPSESNLRPIVTASNLALYHGVAHDETAAPAYTMELPEGVYGGRYDWVSGKLEITYGVIRLAGSDRTWQLGFGNNYTAIPGRAEKAKLFSDRYVQIANPEGIQPGEMALGARNNNVCFGTDLTLEDWKAKLDAQPLEIVYELAEPVVVQLEPTRIVMLDGDNALWSDTGDTEVAYIVDTKEYVDSVAGTGGGAVQSVNGMVGKVVLTAADVGALDKDAEIVDVEARKGVDALSEEIGEVQFHTAMPEGVVGDGVTDDYAAIQALLDAHDYVYLPKGTYYIAAKWLEMLRDNMTFICDGTLIVNTTQALVLSASHCTIKIAHIKCKYLGSWTEENKWKFITSAIKLHATSASVMYNTIEVGYIERCINGFWFVPDGEGLGIAHNTIIFSDVYAERGIYFNPGDQKFVFINGNHFYGGQLRGNHPIYTQKGANQSDPFNGNTFNHVAMEGCQKPMTLQYFYMNKFADLRVIDNENRAIAYPDPLIVFDGESFGNVIETHATLCIDRIVDPEKTTNRRWEHWLGNLYLPKVLTTGEQSVALCLGTRGRSSYGYMIVDGDWHMTTRAQNTSIDLSANKYAIIGHTFQCAADTNSVAITLPMGYRQRAATEFYVYIESITSPHTIKVVQEGVDIIPDTVMTETGLYKAELITSVGWVVTKIDVAHLLPEESLPEIEGEND